MTHTECTTQMKFNIDPLIGQYYNGSLIWGMAIVDAAIKDFNQALLNVIETPESPALRNFGRNFELYVLYDRPSFELDKKICYISFKDLIYSDFINN